MSEEPIRVDVITREEIEEKLLMSSGNISMLVAETAGGTTLLELTHVLISLAVFNMPNNTELTRLEVLHHSRIVNGAPSFA